MATGAPIRVDSSVADSVPWVRAAAAAAARVVSGG
jgi:hypothetical protein